MGLLYLLRLFLSVVSIFVDSLLTLLTGCVPSVVTVTWCTALPCHLLSDVLTNCLSEDQVVECLCEVTYCRVGVATLSNEIFFDGLNRAYTCVWLGIIKEEQHIQMM